MRIYHKVLLMAPILALALLCGARSVHANDSAADTDARRAHQAYTSAINSNNLESVAALPQE